MSVETVFAVDYGHFVRTIRHVIEDGVLLATVEQQDGVEPTAIRYEYDPATWDILTQDRDHGGSSSAVMPIFDGASIAEATEVDTEGSKPWAVRTRYDGDAGRLGDRILWDDGRSETRHWSPSGWLDTKRIADPTDVEPWLFRTVSYHGAARTEVHTLFDDLVERIVQYDTTGPKVRSFEIDHGDAHAWSERSMEFGLSTIGSGYSIEYVPHGYDERVTTFDDGVRRIERWDAEYGDRLAIVETDLEDAHAWSERYTEFGIPTYVGGYSIEYAPHGYDERVTTFDDGVQRIERWDAEHGNRLVTTAVDLANAHAWAERTKTYDVDNEFGLEDMAVVFTCFDDGVETTTTLVDDVIYDRHRSDVGDAYDWHSMTMTYDETGALVEKVIVMDDEVGLLY